jgi:hypothetical protein
MQLDHFFNLTVMPFLFFRGAQYHEVNERRKVLEDELDSLVRN